MSDLEIPMNFRIGVVLNRWRFQHGLLLLHTTYRQLEILKIEMIMNIGIQRSPIWANGTNLGKIVDWLWTYFVVLITVNF